MKVGVELQERARLGVDDGGVGDATHDDPERIAEHGRGEGRVPGGAGQPGVVVAERRVEPEELWPRGGDDAVRFAERALGRGDGLGLGEEAALDLWGAGHPGAAGHDDLIVSRVDGDARAEDRDAFVMLGEDRAGHAVGRAEAMGREVARGVAEQQR